MTVFAYDIPVIYFYIILNLGTKYTRGCSQGPWRSFIAAVHKKFSIRMSFYSHRDTPLYIYISYIYIYAIAVFLSFLIYSVSRMAGSRLIGTNQRLSRAYMVIICSTLPQNKSILTFPFFDGNYPIILLDNIN